jgi:hypothetical protein
MITPLERPLRRLVTVDGAPYVATFAPEGVHLTPKGRRKGVAVSWEDILAGGVELRSRLVGSLSPAQPRTAPRSKR